MSNNPWKDFRSDIIDVLEETFEKLGWSKEGIKKSLEEPPEKSFGDLATTICFELPKKLKKPPSEIADTLANRTKRKGLIKKIKTEGGYVNFFVNESKLSSITLKEIEDKGPKYGHQKNGKGRVIIEHTSVNPTKPLHIGHGRNAIIGDTTARIIEACGHGVEVQNYIDDLGLQVAQTLTLYNGEKQKPEEKFDHYLGRLYVDFHEKLENNPKLEEKARQNLSELEKGDTELAKKARKMASKCVEANLKTSDRLNIDYDLLVWESDISKSGILEETLDRLRETPYLIKGREKHEGALVMKLKEFGLEDKVMVRSDGTAVYTARDLAYQLWKFGDVEADLSFEIHSNRPSGTTTYTTTQDGKKNLNFGDADQVINVIGMEQKYTQQVVFAGLKTLGLEEDYKNSYHMDYEHVRLPSKKFKGREGTWIGYSIDDVIEEATKRAEEEVRKRNPDSGKEFIKEAGEAVGIGAIRYALISSSPEKEVVFKWEEALNFERNSGPAIQYSHARACSILRKADTKSKKQKEDIFEKPKEYELLKKLSKFPETIKEAKEQLQPYKIANYASELALLFNKFYEVAPVIQAKDEALKKARLRLVDCTRIVLRNCLELLGIKATERM